MKSTPLQIIEFETQYSDRLFGPRPNIDSITQTEVMTVMVIEISPSKLLYLGIIDDVDYIYDNVEELLYSDYKNVIITEIPSDTEFSSENEFYKKLSLIRKSPVDDHFSEDDWDFHKIGGCSRFLEFYPNDNIEFITQLAFPDDKDVEIDLNWPTGGYTIEIFRDKVRNEYCVVWRLAA